MMGNSFTHEGNLLRIINNPIWNFKKHAIIVGFLSFMISTLMLSGPIFMLQVYGRVLPSNSTETLIVLFALVAFAFFMMGVSDLVRSRILSRLSLQFMLKVRDKMYDFMTAAPSGGNVMQSMQPMRDLSSVANFIAGAALATIYDVFLMGVYFVAIYALHPWLLAFALIAAVVLFVFALVNHWWSVGPQARLQESMGSAQAVLGNIMGNLDALRAMGMRRNVMRLWSRMHDDGLWWESRAREQTLGILALTKAFRLFLQSAMLALGAWLVLRGELAAGGMIVASILLGRALQPVEQSIMLWKEYQKYKIAKKRLLSFVQSRLAQFRTRSRIQPETVASGHLQARELFVSPPGQQKPLLRNINLDLPAGKILLVTGPNGSGKTLLGKALAGVLPSLSGKVLLDGAEIHTWPEEAWGRNLGYVPQDMQLMEGSIAQNIARFQEQPDEEAVRMAARQAGAHALIKTVGGYDRQVGPNGKWLPRGVCQRIALARALYGSPRLLILDEPEASLDEAGRKELLQALEAMKERGQAVVLISHAPIMEKVADYLMLLKNGEVGRLARKG